MGLVEIPVTGNTLQLAPGLTAGMPIGADVAASKPAMVGTIRVWTEVRVRIDSPSATSGEADERRWRAWYLGVDLGSLCTGLAQRFVDQSGKGLGFLGACASALVGFEGRLGQREWLVGQPEMDKEADEYASNHQELVKQGVQHHNEVLFHGDERGPLYRMRPLLHYPLHSHTRPE